MRLRIAAGALLAAMSLGAQGELQVRVPETDPPSPANLGRNEIFHLRIEFTADEPVSLWARPYYHGKPVTRAKTNPSRKYSGVGSALGWFSLDAADTVDEVRIRAGGGASYREWDVLSVPVQVRGTGQPVKAQRANAPWVQALREANNAAHREEQRRQAAEPSRY